MSDDAFRLRPPSVVPPSSEPQIGAPNLYLSDLQKYSQSGMPTKTDIQGSVYVNQNSYSGCDIKVLVMKYGDASYFATKIEKIKGQIQEAENALVQAMSEASRLMTDIPGLKLGTDKLQRKVTSYNGYRSKISMYQELIQSLNAQMNSLTRGSAEDISTLVLATCQTLSLSTFRDKQTVRACGTVYPKGFTRGPREIAGSLVFTVFDESALYSILEAHPSDFDGVNYSSAVMDQLPPVDIEISFANEYGSISRMEIFGVEFVSDGQTMSIEDILTENVCNYVARDYNPMRKVSQRKMDEGSGIMQQDMAKKCSDLLLESDFQDYKDPTANVLKGELGVSADQRFQNRRNSFI